ncbi:MAG TPA: DUF4942 domain-containing protein [Prolixibacteraceae bacterium]|nr:DUF4942 domain-containing protein [Prolixibacteraceae bacterium]
MFSPDFYPTPSAVISQMCYGLELNGRIILEPSAGKGNIVDYLQLYGANVLACEKDPDLATIVANKCRLLHTDFLEVTPEEISHVDCIIMNPPFSADEKHILHAWTIAPEGCEIIALCNYQTLENRWNRSREQLSDIVKNFGNSENLGEVFTTAERKTDVTIGLVHLFKPRVSTETEFEGYFDMFEEYQRQENGLMPYNDIVDIVNRYIGAIKMFNEVIAASDKMNKVIAPISSGLDIVFGAHRTGRNNSYNAIDRDTFKKELQKSSWQCVFNKMKMAKFITQKLIGELNAFVEKQSNVPFSVPNVYKMLQMIQGTHKERMDRVLVEAFDEICSFSSENSTAGEKWKTNSDYKINRRFIKPHICRYDTKWPKDQVDVGYGSNYSLDDIVKALCYLTGTDYAATTNLGSFIDRMKCQWGQWYEWGFFRIRGYKKGTMHFEFTNDKVWELFNRRVAEIKGWALPRKTDAKQKGTERVKETGLMMF